MKAYNLLLLLAAFLAMAPTITLARVSVRRPDCSGIEDGAAIEDPRRCCNYYVCHKGRALHKSCGRFFSFDVDSKGCKLATLVKCTDGNGKALREAEPRDSDEPTSTTLSEDPKTTTPCTTPKTTTPCGITTTARPCDITTTPCDRTTTTTPCDRTTTITPCDRTTTTTPCDITTTTTPCDKTTTTTPCDITTTTTPCDRTTTSTPCDRTTTTRPCDRTTTTTLCNGPQDTTTPCDEKTTSSSTEITTTNNPVTLSFGVHQMFLRENDCSNLNDGAILLDARHCRRYFICQRGVALRQKCRLGQWYDRDAKTCRNRRLVHNCIIKRN